jgi:hypothetical protein
MTMGLNVGQLAKAMTEAAKGKLSDHWPEVKEFAKAEAKKTAETLSMIEKLALAGEINAKQAKALLSMQKNSALAVLLTVQGLGLLTVESAINAALGAVKETVNTALGFLLL